MSSGRSSVRMRDRASPQKLGPPWAAFFLWDARANYRTTAAYWSDVQPLVHARLMSAFGSKADIEAPPSDVRFTPQKRTFVERVGMSAMCQKRTSVRVLD